MKISIILILITVSVSTSVFYSSHIYGQETFRQLPFDRSQNEPHVTDANLKVEVIAEGLNLPTTMAFLGPDDFLILEKDKGTVMRISKWNNIRQTLT